SFCDVTAATELYTLSLHDALPIFGLVLVLVAFPGAGPVHLGFELVEPILELVVAALFLERLETAIDGFGQLGHRLGHDIDGGFRSEEHTSELQSRENLVCRLLLEK